MTFEELEAIALSLNNQYSLEDFDEQYNGWECGHCRMPFKTNFIVQPVRHGRYNFYFRCNHCTYKLKGTFEDWIIVLTDQDVFTLRLIMDLPMKNRR